MYACTNIPFTPRFHQFGSSQIACYSVVAAKHGGSEGHNNAYLAIPTVSAPSKFYSSRLMFDANVSVAIQVCSLVERVETSVSTCMFRQTRWVSTKR